MKEKKGYYEKMAYDYTKNARGKTKQQQQQIYASRLEGARILVKLRDIAIAKQQLDAKYNSLLADPANYSAERRFALMKEHDELFNELVDKQKVLLKDYDNIVNHTLE